MSTRAGKPDTSADVDIRTALSSTDRKPFVVTAGAGSGKTTSLIKALNYVVKEYGEALRSRNQQVACITYTQIAADEIYDDVGNDPLVLVCTIHSFLWTLAKPFQADIRNWVDSKINVDAEELRNKSYGPRVRQTTKDKDAAKLASLEEAQRHIKEISSFTYGTASDYAAGILGHEDILSIAPDLIQKRPLLSKIVAQKFPFIFVDESQDTFESVVSSLKHIQQESNNTLSLGFFGDPMQSIYQRGAGEIKPEDGWISIDKPENYRSSLKVLEVINAVRKDGDSLVQTPGRENTPEGEAFFFVLPADDGRVAHLTKVRAWLDENATSKGWTDEANDSKLKILAIVHRMAARRLNFENLFAAFNDNGSSLSDDFREGNPWPITPFRDVILPILQASSISDAKVLDIIRNNSLLFKDVVQSSNVKSILQDVIKAIQAIRDTAEKDEAGSVGAILRLAIESKILTPDPRFLAFFSGQGSHDGVDVPESTTAVLNDYINCKVSEVINYRQYVEEESPYSTQHGTKGSEFDKVIVILDDDEGRYWLYSFEKYLGIKPLSRSDETNIQEGAETIVDRTRRLFYVCVSRAMTSLAVLLFTDDVGAGVAALKSSGVTGSADVLTLDTI
jgi:DNA helicase-2/ATP-dependent DNA helicase PcrA